jgi:hypothetical protein
MATYRAVGAACEAVVRLLQQSWRRDLFDGADLQFDVYRTKDFSTPMKTGVSLFPWANDASLEQVILGWMMRTIEDTPILPAGLLNTLTAGVFEAGETIEIVAGQLSNEEMFRIWDVLPNDYQISVPYTARIVRIDSELDQREDKLVLTRKLDYGVLKDL